MKHPLRPVFLASFFFSFHLALLSYLNSSVLATHVDSVHITLAYTTASILSIICVFVAPTLIGRMGASVFVRSVLIGSTVLLALMTLMTSTFGFVGLFVVYFALNAIVWYGFDVVMEHYSRVQNTGNIRGTYLTFNNIGWVIAPTLASIISTKLGYTGAYMLACGASLLALIVVSITPKVPHAEHAPRLHFRQAFGVLTAHPYARRLVSLYFVLQFFFAWMVVYMVPYLTGLGFSLRTIGIILSFMLLPFVLFQYLTGIIADRYRNERSIIIAGFCIMGLATLVLALPDTFIYAPTAVFFAVVLFLTRVGASIIEVGIESKFFKVVTEHDTALISTLRMTVPLAYIIAPLIAALLLTSISVQGLFAILGLICLGAMLYAFRLKESQ